MDRQTNMGTVQPKVRGGHLSAYQSRKDRKPTQKRLHGTHGEVTTHPSDQTDGRLVNSPCSVLYDDPNTADKPKTCRAKVRMRIGTANVGTMVKRSSIVVEMVSRRNLDICCLQETKWKGGSARIIEGGGKKYKFFYKGCNEGTSGVGILVAEKWTDKVVDVRRINERIIVLRMMIGKRVLNIISAYAPHSGRSMREKEEFWMKMTDLLISIKDEESVFVGGDMNGHVGTNSDGYQGVHGGYGYGLRNPEGEMLLEFAVATDLVITNTFFKKEESKVITYESGGNRLSLLLTLFW